MGLRQIGMAPMAVALVLAGAVAAADETPRWYVRKSTAHETYYASLAAKNAPAPPSKAPAGPADVKVPKGKMVLGPWHYVGPFTGAKPFDEAYGPEKGPVDLKATYVGKGGKQVGWKVGSFKDGEAHDLVAVGSGENCAMYLHRTITAAGGPQKVSFGSDDGIKVWLNGKRVLSNYVGRAVNLGDEKTVLSLQPGTNHLLLKIVNGGGPSGFAFALGHVGRPASRTPTTAKPYDEGLFECIRRDFPAAEVHKLTVEFDWLHWDKLTADGGDFKAAAAEAVELAKRTLARVAACKALPGLEAELKGLAARLAAAADAADWRELYFEVRRLRRRIALADPLLGFAELLIVKRGPPLYSHMCDQYLGRHSQAGEGLTILSDWRRAPKARRMIPPDKLPEGCTHHPDLSYDAGRVVFGFCPHAEEDRSKRWFYLWEAAVDGSFVRRLTGVEGRDKFETQDGRHTVYVEDWDPCYLPDGDVMFVSTRNQAFGRCHGGRYTPSYVLYRCDADGNDIRRISWGEANEWDPSVLHDGTIVYTRWDYINRHDTIFQSLWTTRPDGTATGHFFGNNSRNPCMIAQARAIPGSDKVVATAMAHHSYTTGSTIVIDVLKGRDGPGPVTRITPEISFPEGGDRAGTLSGSFSDPWPLSEEVFLCSYQPDPQAWQGRVQRYNAYGIYLVDTSGGRELIYRDPEVSCFSPIPLVPRPRPPVLASSLAPGAPPEGVFFLHDVYRTGRGEIPAGQAKYLRVVGINEQPAAGAAGRSVAANEIVKYVVGTVPFEADGSVAFRAPANEPLLFQVLDANYMSLMSMRTQVYLQPGEKMSCVGCHEPTGAAAPVRLPRPLRVQALTPPPWAPNPDGLNYPKTVQPVWDRYCIGCHGLGRPPKAPPTAARAPAPEVSAGEIEALLASTARKAAGKPAAAPARSGPAGGVNLLGTVGRFTTSYDSLVGRRGLVSVAHRNGETHFSKPKDYGAHAGKLAAMLLSGHPDKDGNRRVQLDLGSLQRVTAWLDLNAQFCGDYTGRGRPERRQPNAQGEADLRAYLRQCGGELAGMADESLAALVNAARPDESRVLNAPLAIEAGGWGQCKAAWPDKSAEPYQQMRQKILAALGGDAR